SNDKSLPIGTNAIDQENDGGGLIPNSNLLDGVGKNSPRDHEILVAQPDSQAAIISNDRPQSTSDIGQIENGSQGTKVDSTSISDLFPESLVQQGVETNVKVSSNTISDIGQIENGSQGTKVDSTSISDLSPESLVKQGVETNVKVSSNTISDIGQIENGSQGTKVDSTSISDVYV